MTHLSKLIFPGALFKQHDHTNTHTNTEHGESKMKYLNIENAAINWKKEKVICSFISKRGISTSILLRDILSLMAVGLVY